jgi:cytochrome c oxidase assembly factor CtaG/putative copper export protein
MPADAMVTAAAVVRDLAVAGTVGGLILVVAVLPQAHAATTRALLIARIASAVWGASGIVFSMASYATIRGATLTPEVFVEEWWAFSTGVALGQAYLWMAVGGVLVSILAGLVVSPGQAAWTLVPVAWALGWQAQTGHTAGAVDHHLAVSSMWVHLVGSAMWPGIIAALMFARRSLGDDTKSAVMRGSKIALWGAALVIASGVANAWLRLASPVDFVTTPYGRLLLLKIALMVMVVALAFWHRRVSLPRLDVTQVRERFWSVMLVDVAALMGVIAVAVVLSGTAPPLVPAPLDTPSPAFMLTGYELPPAPTFQTWMALWRLEIITAFAIAAAAVTYARWALRLRSRGDHWPWYRSASFLVGAGILAWITQGGPAIYGMVSFSGHMIEHMVLVMVAPIPLVLGAPVTLALRALSPRTDGSRGPREWLRALVESRLLRLLAHPVVAATNFAGSLVIFYYTPIFEFTLSNHAGHLAMIAHFTAAGYFFVNALIGIDPGPTRPRYPLRIVMLFATMAFHAFFGVALLSSEVLLAPRWFGLMGRDWGADALADQQYGGQIAWGIGELPVLLLAIGVMMAWRQADTREGTRKDRQADRDGDAELKAYNEMLTRMGGPKT